jgi:predicted enzyme related to lactoylglutathione lyase
MSTHGTFVWNEAVTADQKKSGEFYSALLGWNRRELNAGAFGTYTLFQKNGRDIAGMMFPASEYSRIRPAWWSAYVDVADIEKVVARVKQLGGHIVEALTDLPNLGRACLIADPGGAVICLVMPTAAAGENPASGPFIWHHLVTTEQAESGPFYCELLGWTRREVDAGQFGIYTIFQRDGKDVAGIMMPTIDYTRSRPPSWYAYVTVDNVDALSDRVTKLGGTIIEPPHDVPGFGRVCLIADPMGAPLSLVTPEKARS